MLVLFYTHFKYYFFNIYKPYYKCIVPRKTFPHLGPEQLSTNPYGGTILQNELKYNIITTLAIIF